LKHPFDYSSRRAPPGVPLPQELLPLEGDELHTVYLSPPLDAAAA